MRWKLVAVYLAVASLAALWACVVINLVSVPARP